MLNLNDWSKGKSDMESVLNRYGLTAGIMSKYADQAIKNLRFMLIMDFITEEEMQRIVYRIVGRIGQYIHDNN